MTAADHGEGRLRNSARQTTWNAMGVYVTWGLLLTVCLAVWTLVVYLALGVVFT